MTGTPSAARRDALLALLLGTVSIATYLIYPVLNHGPGKIFLRTPPDRAIPLVPVMVIPYLSLTPLIIVAAVVLAIADLRRVQALFLAVTVALLVSYLVYALAQSYVIRPSPAGRDWLTAAVRHVYALDRPYNDFPSLHTSLSAIVAVLWLRTHRRTGALVAVWCSLIVASTVLVHQHYLADVAGGLLVAWLAVAASDRITGRIHHDPPGEPPLRGRCRRPPTFRFSGSGNPPGECTKVHRCCSGTCMAARRRRYTNMNETKTETTARSPRPALVAWTHVPAPKVRDERGCDSGRHGPRRSRSRHPIVIRPDGRVPYWAYFPVFK